MSMPPKTFNQKRSPGLSPASRKYALERANEVFGHRPSKGFSAEAFIAIAVTAVGIMALKGCI